MKDFVIYFSGYGSVKDQTVLSLEALRRNRHYQYEVRFVTGDALIGRSRSRAATHFLRSNDSPMMIFIDTDIVFQPEDIDGLVDTMNTGLDVVAGGYAVANGEHLAIHGSAPVTFDGRLAEIEYVSTGFMAISRDTLNRVRDELNLPLLHEATWCECYPFFESYSVPPLYISEDWDFCKKVRSIGGHVMLHTGVLVGHVKEHTLDARDAIRRMAEVTVKERNQQEFDLLMQDMAEFTGQSNDDTYQGMVEGYGRTCKEAPTYDYHTSEAQLYDLANFNSMEGYATRLQPLQGMTGKKILDFGCGIGTAVLKLAANRNEVTGYDINQKCLQFAEFRRRKFGYEKVRFIDTLPDEIDADLVIAIDVFEHIKDIDGALKDLSSRMRTGAQLYFFSPWGHAHPLHITGRKETFEALGKYFTAQNENWAVK